MTDHEDAWSDSRGRLRTPAASMKPERHGGNRGCRACRDRGRELDSGAPVGGTALDGRRHTPTSATSHEVARLRVGM